MLSIADTLANQLEHYKFLLKARPNDAAIHYSISRLLDRAKAAGATSLVDEISQFLEMG